jgi:hypothetical protein
MYTMCPVVDAWVYGCLLSKSLQVRLHIKIQEQNNMIRLAGVRCVHMSQVTTPALEVAKGTAKVEGDLLALVSLLQRFETGA